MTRGTWRQACRSLRLRQRGRPARPAPISVQRAIRLTPLARIAVLAKLYRARRIWPGIVMAQPVLHVLTLDANRRRRWPGFGDSARRSCRMPQRGVIRIAPSVHIGATEDAAWRRVTHVRRLVHFPDRPFS